MHKRACFLDYTLVAGSTTECVDEIADSIFNTNDLRWFACLNPHSHVISKNDLAFSDALHDADWLVPDGAGVVIASRFLGCPVYERITGSDVFFGLHERLNTMGKARIFFLGSTEEILAEIQQRMSVDYPKLQVAGTYSPPYKTEFSLRELDEMVAAINRAKPDVLWVGMTAPKQEKWIHQNRHRLNVKFIGAVGAVFDFYTGRVKRSHPVFQKLGFEWLPRLVQEPRRLWRRMGISAPIFLWHVLNAKLKNK